jgi:hypothetical protein
MKVHVLFGQRKCDYPGQYAPEALEVADENAYSDNPDFLNGKLKEHTATEEFSALVIVAINVDGGTIDRILNNHPTIPGTIDG